MKPDDTLEMFRQAEAFTVAGDLPAAREVLGAVLDAIEFGARTLEVELNASTDNPLVFDGEVLSGGNFHGQPVAQALDFLAIALTTLQAIAERRVERLVKAVEVGHGASSKVVWKRYVRKSSPASIGSS